MKSKQLTVSISDLYLAYRKAKWEAFHDRQHPSAVGFAVYEEDLHSNLVALRRQLSSPDIEWWNNLEFIGTHLYVPKSIDDTVWNSIDDLHFRSIDPSEDWKSRYEKNHQKKAKVKFRLIIWPTVNFQIISALWILKVGHKLDASLNPSLSFGHRLRRKGIKSEVNTDSPALFAPYYTAYQNWRRQGLDMMRSLLVSGESVTAITMDVASFYHNVSPEFIVRPAFLEQVGVQLSSDELEFTLQLLAAMRIWYASTPDYSEERKSALPVGLSASKIIANLVLYEFDTKIAEKFSPAYYGRYVDDIFLVFKSIKQARSAESVIELIRDKVDCLKLVKKAGSPIGLRLDMRYAKDSELRFTPEKQKIFSLSGEHGLDLVNQISSQIREQSSEYRLLPELPVSSIAMAKKALLATPHSTHVADALRKADAVSVRRLGFAILLRDVESYSKDLDRNEWQSVRREFYDLVMRYVLSPKGLFEFFTYYPRIVAVMVANKDFDRASTFLKSLRATLRLLKKTTSRANDSQFKKARSYFRHVLFQCALQASSARQFREWPQLKKLVSQIDSLSEGDKERGSESDLRKTSRRLLLSDLGGRAYKDYWYFSQKRAPVSPELPKSIEHLFHVPLIREYLDAVEPGLNQPFWPALIFPTRPLTIQEIVLVAPSVLENEKLFKNAILGLRGAFTSARTPIMKSITREERTELLVDEPLKRKIKVAVTNFETTDEQFEMAIVGRADRSLERYSKLNSIVNRIITSQTKVDYLVFPEVSFPRRWAISAAHKLGGQGISFLAGLEHYTTRRDRRVVRNDCLVSLSTRWPGYLTNFIYIQPKIEAAIEEREALEKVGKSLFRSTGSALDLPVYLHGSFSFGILICSDLTNPSNRVRFQGEVDALFVLEWNKDVRTFSTLLEASSHDVHCFLVQVNNRQYGDSRIRAPYRVEHERDIVRIKGGVEDYFVIGEIDYIALRSYQRKRKVKPGQGEFKPVPAGFKMSRFRKKAV